MCKRFWSPEIDSEESIQLAYVAWRASTTNKVVVPAARLEIDSWLLNPHPDGPLVSPLTDGPRSDWTLQKTSFDDVS